MTPSPILRLERVIIVDLGQRIAVHVDDVVKEVHGRGVHDLAQPFASRSRRLDLAMMARLMEPRLHDS